MLSRYKLEFKLLLNCLISTGIVMLIDRRRIIEEVIMLSEGRRSTGSF